MSNTSRLRLTAIALTAFSTLTLAACGSDDSDEGASAGSDGKTLTVCSDVPYPPFEDFDTSSPTGFKGFDIDIVSEVAKRLGREIKIQDSAFDPLQNGSALNSGTCDMAASAMTINEDRQKSLDFSEGYYDSQQSLLVAKGSDIKAIGDLDGVKVGVQQGTTGKAYAEENAKGAEIVTFPGDPEMFQAIKAGQVDALLQDLPVNLEHTKDGAFSVVETYKTDEKYGLAMKKGNTELVKQVDDALAAMREDGTYDTIYNKYFEVQ